MVKAGAQARHRLGTGIGLLGMFLLFSLIGNVGTVDCWFYVRRSVPEDQEKIDYRVVWLNVVWMPVTVLYVRCVGLSSSKNAAAQACVVPNYSNILCHGKFATRSTFQAQQRSSRFYVLLVCGFDTTELAPYGSYIYMYNLRAPYCGFFVFTFWARLRVVRP